jgi:hypothetical protein
MNEEREGVRGDSWGETAAAAGGGGGRKRYLDEDFLEARIHAFLVQLIAVERHALDEFLHRALRFERKERQAERDVAPLARVLREPEALAELFDDALCLLFLFFRACRASVGEGKG